MNAYMDERDRWFRRGGRYAGEGPEPIGGHE